jgi:uracil-DNA glycosylase
MPEPPPAAATDGAGLETLLSDIRACRACAAEFDHEPRPVIRVGAQTRLLICGQAPGRRVQMSGLPFDDASGDRLRDWLGLDRAVFYRDPRIGVAPMAFCYPGTRPEGGDRPPPPRCAALWRAALLSQLPRVELTLLVGSYAQQWSLGATGRSMTETVAAWRDFGPSVIPLPHPSWRATGWLRRNTWFEAQLLPELRVRVASLLAHDAAP